MHKKVFSKPALTYEEQLNRFQERGLHVEDRAKALHLLEHISYYRLSAYFYPLLEDAENHVFSKDATFQQAFDLYCFDRELRQLVGIEIEKIEVSVRAEMIYRLSHKYDAFWYTYPELFKDKDAHSRFMLSVQKMYNETNEAFIKSYNRKYVNNYLPSWMAMEIITFGSLSLTYSNLSDFKVKAEIAEKYGLKAEVFESWLHILVYIRNICAHHGRLWTREFSIISPKVKTKPKFAWLSEGNTRNKAYFNIAIVKYLINCVNPGNTLTERLNSLFQKYPTVQLSALGFPENWKDEDLWNTKGY